MINYNNEEILPRTSGIKFPIAATGNILLDTPRSKPEYAALMPFFDFLSTKCVFNKATKEYNIVLKNGYVVEEKRHQHAIKRLQIEYMGDSIKGSVIPLSEDIIKRYGDYVNPVNGTLSAPFQEKLIKFNGDIYINNFVDRSIIATNDISQDEIEYFDQYIKLLCRGVFGITDYDMTYEKLMDIIVKKNYEKREDKKAIPSKEELIDFFFSWVSAIYHNPGINISTIPCLFGIPGTGKSTFSKIICDLIGNSNSNISQNSTTGKFNALLEGKLVVVYNEVKDNPTFYNDIVKGTLTEANISIEHKGSDAYTSLNICNGILMSNNITPFKIDADDRRLVIISGITVNQDQMASYKIKEANAEFLSDDEWEVILPSIFAKIIRHVKFDKKILNNGAALTTETKKLMMESYQSPIERFFEDENVKFIEIDTSKSLTTQRKTSMSKLQALFSEWMEYENGLGNVTSNYSKTVASFKTDVQKLAISEKYVMKDKNSNFYFTEIFYDEYVKKNSNVVEIKSRLKRA